MLDQLLTAPIDRAPCETVAQWWPHYREVCLSNKNTLNRAIAGGFAADRVGWAFTSGYQAALHALFPGAPEDRICALCVTEEEGNSPRAIKTTLSRNKNNWMLNGSKRWTTLGPDGSLFFVAARDEAASGKRVSIRVVRVPSGSKGIEIQEMPPTKFVPEVPHARLRFENVSVKDEDLLPGDGYDGYVKPFRTVEDLHVNAAILAYLVREARRLGWPQAWIEKAVAALSALEKLSGEDPSSPSTHIALAGTLAITSNLFQESEVFWEERASDPAAQRWRRDRELLKVAGTARELRTQRAWERVMGRNSA